MVPHLRSLPMVMDFSKVHRVRLPAWRSENLTPSRPASENQYKGFRTCQHRRRRTTKQSSPVKGNNHGTHTIRPDETAQRGPWTIAAGRARTPREADTRLIYAEPAARATDTGLPATHHQRLPPFERIRADEEKRVALRFPFGRELQDEVRRLPAQAREDLHLLRDRPASHGGDVGSDSDGGRRLMASDFNSIAKAIRYLGDCVRYLADKYVAVNDRVYSDWNEASKVVGDVGRDHVADYAEASHKQGKSRTWRHSHLMEREEQLSMQSRGSHVDPE
nr:MAG TPA: hypothetical protein [Caudoviricetes sp.]